MKYKNPVIRGFNPDPSICKVENDYYLATSSFEYFPGIPVYHSTDLVNWELIGNCIERTEQLPMEEAYASGGIWASTIRYNEGVFYVTATFSGIGNFIVSSENPAKGWSNPVWVEMDGIDPSMFFENGTMYYCANDCGMRGNANGGKEGISVAEMDVHTGKVIGEIKTVWNGTGGGFLEAPHIYHIGEWYYMIAAEGGTSYNHMAVTARSKSIWGPYESCPYNPILTNRNDVTKQALCCGHADLFEDNDGNWWMVHLGTRFAVSSKSNLGRETFLTPVVWNEGWFAADGIKAVINVETFGNAEQKDVDAWKADFENDEWEKQWIFLRKPFLENYIRKDGKITLYPTLTKITDEDSSPTFAAVRQGDFCCEISTRLKFETVENGDEAGLALYLAPKFVYRIYKKRKNDRNYIIVEKTADDFNEIAYCAEADRGDVRFYVTSDREKYSFYYSIGESDNIYACSASTRFLTCEIAGKCFTGTVAGLYAQSDRKTKAVAEVYEFGQRYKRD